MIIQLAEEDLILVEKATYTVVDFFSDFGGTVGLFLGLNLFALVKLSCDVFHRCRWRTSKVKIVHGSFSDNITRKVHSRD
jgi:hypothetical protein